MDSAAEPKNVLLCTAVLILAGLKTMAYLKIFKSMALLITMIRKAFADLTQFLLFFLIVLVLFTFICGVLGF